jgi:pimeloyl-ACP methyl ester carboxylesterase
MSGSWRLRAVAPAGLLVPVVVATVLLAGCTGGTGGTHASSPLSPAFGNSGGASGLGGASGGTGSGGTALHWGSCPSGEVSGAPDATKLRCSSLRVPLNYQQPSGRAISIVISELPATAPASQQQGVLLVNPGGPGASGLSLAGEVASVLSPSVASEYDIIGFDTRGVGASDPSLTCDASFFSRPRPEYDPANAQAEQVLIDRAKLYAADCKKKFGWMLPYMTTQDNARDMDSIRAALGAPKISYLGYSYGTYLGQVYATMFPTRVRRMVLDSVVDPRGAWYQDNISQDYAFQGRMNAFFAWTAAANSTFHLGSTTAQVAAAFARASAKLEAHPLAGPSGGPLVGPDELSDTFLAGGYSNSFWPYMAGALASYLSSGSGSDLVQLYQQVGVQGENEFAVYNAVECSDVNWPRNWSTWNTDMRKANVTAPYETWANTWFNAACAFWPVKGPAQPLHINGSGLPPILMLQGTLDPATPYQGALAARRLLPSARMVVVEGGGNHGQSLSSPPNRCVLGYLDRYLGNGGLPSGTGTVSATCPALPAPAP